MSRGAGLRLNPSFLALWLLTATLRAAPLTARVATRDQGTSDCHRLCSPRITSHPPFSPWVSLACLDASLAPLASLDVRCDDGPLSRAVPVEDPALQY